MTETAPIIAPLLLGAKQAAALCGVSPASWWTYLAAGRIPLPIKIGGRTLWRREELEKWIAADCPPRVRWETMRGGRP